ncbi:MAG: M64 family metallopeptidase [Lysobacterales bacterium]
MNIATQHFSAVQQIKTDFQWRVAIVAGLLALLCVSSAHGAATHYLVLELNPGSVTDSAPAVTYYQQIDMSHRTPAKVSSQRWHNTLLAVDANGLVVARVSTATHHRTEPTITVVLRVPASAPSVVVQHWGESATLTHQWSVDDLIGIARERGATVKGGSVEDERSLNRVNLLLMGEGYTAAEEDKFHQDVDRALEGFFAIEPYRSYREFLDVHPYFVRSNQSGADHPGCEDTDPKAPLEVDTAFNGTFCTAGFDRLLTVDRNAVARVAAEAPFPWDRVAVIVNDDTYGGAGGFFTTFSTHPLSPELLIHEWGHSFTLLTDEYEDFANAPTCSDRDLSLPPCEANATDETRRTHLKWRGWVDESVAIPTPTNLGTREVVGLFEGARYQSQGMYRPIQQCAMRSLGREFCPVCAQTYVSTLYGGGWGLPDNGISVIEPASQIPSPAETITLNAGQSLALSAKLLMPAHGVETQWAVDGQLMTSATATPNLENPSLATTATFNFQADLPGQYEITLTAIDRSPFLSGALDAQQRLFSETWTIQAEGFSASGLWFDPAKEGEGFNVIEAGGTITVFYFGYRADGSRLWLVSNSVSGPVPGNEPLALEMMIGGEGRFQTPASPDSLQRWGTLQITLDSCDTGTFTLNGEDGEKVSAVVRLAATLPNEC